VCASLGELVPISGDKSLRYGRHTKAALAVFELGELGDDGVDGQHHLLNPVRELKFGDDLLEEVPVDTQLLQSSVSTSSTDTISLRGGKGHTGAWLHENE
jgi:hypothetical protein